MSKTAIAKRKKIALLGESPNDTIAFINLLSRKYSEFFDFFILIQNVRGSQLDNTMSKKALAIEYRYEKPDYVIVIRDLDDLITNKSKIREKKAYFKEVNKLLEGKGIFLLNIFEIEALLLADINTLNSYYKASFSFEGDPMSQVEPKEIIHKWTKKKYSESDCIKMFKTLDFDILLDKCSYFKKFITDFEAFTKIAA